MTDLSASIDLREDSLANGCQIKPRLIGTVGGISLNETGTQPCPRIT